MEYHPNKETIGIMLHNIMEYQKHIQEKIKDLETALKVTNMRIKDLEEALR